MRRTLAVSQVKQRARDRTGPTDGQGPASLNGTTKPGDSNGLESTLSDLGAGSVPVWFGPGDSPLFGLVDSIGSNARGAVVLCYPLAREQTSAYRTFGRLANLLARRGFLVLRFDYRSTGDSFDRPADAESPLVLLDDVRQAIDFAGGLVDGPVTLIGMRIGGLLAALAGGTQPLDAAVLWDPCPSGRSFVRQQRVLSLGVPGSGEATSSDEIPGFYLPPEMLRELSTLELVDGATSRTRKVLLLTREGRSGDQKFLARLTLPHVELRKVSDQGGLLDVATPEQVIPVKTVDLIVQWLDSVTSTVLHPVSLPHHGGVTFTLTGGGIEDMDRAPVVIVEEAVRLGPSGLFGISSRRRGFSSGPAAIFVSVANEHRIGPGRLWVELSRHLASLGFRCLRLDLGGVGDSQPRPGNGPDDIYSYSAIEEVIEAAQAFSPEDPSDVVLFGLCSSAYHVLEAAVALTPRGVCAINPAVSFPLPEAAAGGKADPRRRFFVQSTQVTAIKQNALSLGWIERQLPGVRSLRLRFPGASWKVRHVVRRSADVFGRPFRELSWKIGTKPGRNRTGPAEQLAELVRSGTNVLLVCGTEEMRPFRRAADNLGSGSDVSRGLRMELVPALDHALRRPSDRSRVSEVVVEYVDTLFGS
jgi:pimeloyl-ACP methyl ester carboxylesterase